MPKSSGNKVTNYRSAISGQFVKESYAKTHKSTTTVEHNPRRTPTSPPKSK